MAVKEPKNPAKREPEYVDKPSPFSIEGIRSGAVQSRVVKAMIVMSGLIMAGTFAISSLNPTGVPQNGNGAAPQLNPKQTVATVGDQTITSGEVFNAFQRSVELNARYGFGAKPTVATYLDQKQAALQRLTDDAALIVAAKKAGFTASDEEVDKEIDKQFRDGFKPDPGQSEAAFLRLVQTRYKVGSIDEAIAQEKSKLTAEDRERTRDKLIVEKLEKQTKATVKTTEADYKKSVTKLDLYQIVLQPGLPKGNVKDFVAEQKRLQEAAKTKANKLFAQLKANPTLANFKTVATKESSDTLTKAKGGALGLKLPSEIQPTDTGTALSKSTSPLVGPFDNGGGAQTIYFIAGRKVDLPPSYEKNKKTTLATFQTGEENSVWQKKQEELQKQVVPQVTDAALAGYQLQTKDLYTKKADEQNKMREDIIARYDEALQTSGGMEAAAINYQKSTLYRDMGQKQPQLEALKAAVAADKNDPGLLIAYGQALQDGGQPKVALDQYKAASLAMDNNPSPPSPFGGNPDDGMRQQIATQFELLKEPKLAAAERAKIKPSAPAMQGANGLNFGNLPPGIKVTPGK